MFLGTVVFQECCVQLPASPWLCCFPLPWRGLRRRPRWPSPTWNSVKQTLTQSGISEDQVIQALLPIAQDFGVNATIREIGTAESAEATQGNLNNQFDRAIENSPATMVVVPGGGDPLGAVEGIGHVVVEQYSPNTKTVTYVDPATPAPVPLALPTMSVADAQNQYMSWGISGGGYVVVVKHH
jgi:hypothetical protein